MNTQKVILLKAFYCGKLVLVTVDSYRGGGVTATTFHHYILEALILIFQGKLELLAMLCWKNKEQILIG